MFTDPRETSKTVSSRTDLGSLVTKVVCKDHQNYFYQITSRYSLRLKALEVPSERLVVLVVVIEIFFEFVSL